MNDIFTKEEESTILEIARVALSDAEVYDYFADKLDLADDELKALQGRIESITDNSLQEKDEKITVPNQWDVTIEARIVKTIRVSSPDKQKAVEEAHEIFSVLNDDTPEEYEQNTKAVNKIA